MIRPIINIEINELPKEILFEYININKRSFLAKLFNNNQINIFETFAGDVKKKDLYPSQTWASMLTGSPFEKHKCYWYSDPINKKSLIWNKLINKGKSIGILGSVHSSKLPDNLENDNNIKFYIPDCFSDQETTKPIKYSSFQGLNTFLVGESARVVSPKSLILNLTKYTWNIISNPSSFGISFYSCKEILKIIFRACKSRNPEYLRTAQFPLISEIFIQNLKNYIPDYSSLFTNHLAGNMHRYWYAYNTNQYSKKDIYKSSWLKRNKNALFFPMDMIDIFLKKLIKDTKKKNPIILLTGSMGQEARKDFSSNSDVNITIDGKIKDLKLFLLKLNIFIKKNYQINDNIKIQRNMAPQYGFTLKNKKKALEFYKDVNKFLQKLGFSNFKIDINTNSVVLTIDPWHDEKIQNLIKDKKNKLFLQSNGFKFFKIDDHHSGKHTEKGIFAVINPDPYFVKLIEKREISEQTINYLDFSPIIREYLVDSQ